MTDEIVPFNSDFYSHAAPHDTARHANHCFNKLLILFTATNLWLPAAGYMLTGLVVHWQTVMIGDTGLVVHWQS